MSDSEESYDTNDIEHQFLVTINLIETMLEELEVLESQLEKLHRPILHLHLEQIGNLDFLASSPFRHAKFAFKKPQVAILASLDPNCRHSYETICTKLREALIKINGSLIEISLNKDLQSLFETKESSVSFVRILGLLRNILL
jgi:hypothetical protein